MTPKCLLLLSIVMGLVAGCAGPNPISVGSPIAFQHRTTAFTMRVPDGWTQVQDEVATEALGIFTDPTGQALITAYMGLLDRRLADEEGLAIVGTLASTLLSNPDDFQVTDQRRRPDGAFEVTFAFTGGEQKHAGRAIFRDTHLALSGVIISGPQQHWNSLQNALAPYVDSFTIDPEVVRASYFDILEDTYYILVVPIDWPRRRGAFGTEVISRSGRMSIRLLQHDLGKSIAAADIADQTVMSLRTAFNLVVNVLAAEQLPDNRLEITLEQAGRRIIGYVETFDTHLVGLFFDVPADRVDDYQPFMDFVYSTYISGLP